MIDETSPQSDFKVCLRGFYINMVNYLDGDGESLLKQLKMIPKSGEDVEVLLYSKARLKMLAKMVESLYNHNSKYVSYYADQIKIIINYK